MSTDTSASGSGLATALWPRGAAGQREFLRESSGRAINYDEARARSAQLAHALAGLKVRAADRVAVQVEKSATAVLLYLAVLRLGAVYLPLNTAYTEAELAYFLGDAEPALLVCTPERAAALQALSARLQLPALATLGSDGESGTLIDAAASLSPHFEDTARTSDDLAAILYTSGTTGRSKGAMLTHGNLIANARTLAALWRFTAADRLLHALPLFHIHGLFVAINVTIAAGASVLLLPRFDATLLLRHLPDATVLMGVPTHYIRLLAEPALSRKAAAHMRLFICGSAPLLPETHQAFRERTGHAILERYGLSETGMNCSNPYEGERRPGSVGLPLPDVQLRIVDQAGAQVAGVGMIEVRGPNVFAGYWRNPERTHEAIRADGYFITGDLGQRDADGYVTIVGRARDLIISGGYNVYPREVELEIDALPGVLESAVIGLPHPDLGEAVTAVIVPAKPAPEEAQLLAALRQRLAGYKLPKRVLFVAELPRNIMGKVQKAQLQRTYSDLYAAVQHGR
ncbi:MAG TPA: malonyl-CoA synthase [Steroidobacteraceae bacterium]|jgi:malonyl-CoA/methylmalonyl-CoA synthetase|nr:malonyl-CoA synthase [Steroidobacteraceae bacterium]